jgi:hypothetical protein
MKLALLLIVALLAGTIECAASCAAVNGESSCHHDQKSPIACAHELVLERTHSIAILPAAFTLTIVDDQVILVDSPFFMRRDREEVRISAPLRI